MRVTHLLLICVVLVPIAQAQENHDAQPFAIPKAWNEDAISSLDLPRADHQLQVEHVSAEYYYQLPIRKFYKSYPVYHPSKEPKPDGKDYLTWLKNQPPQVILHDFSQLKTQADWATKGRIPSVRTPGGHRRYPAHLVRQLLDEAGGSDTV